MFSHAGDLSCPPIRFWNVLTFYVLTWTFNPVEAERGEFKSDAAQMDQTRRTSVRNSCWVSSSFRIFYPVQENTNLLLTIIITTIIILMRLMSSFIWTLFLLQVSDDGAGLPVTVEFEQVKAEVMQWPFRLLLLLFLHVELLRLHVRRQGGAGILSPLTWALQDRNNDVQWATRWSTEWNNTVKPSCDCSLTGSSSLGRQLHIWRERRPPRQSEATWTRDGRPRSVSSPTRSRRSPQSLTTATPAGKDRKHHHHQTTTNLCCESQQTESLWASKSVSSGQVVLQVSRRAARRCAVAPRAGSSRSACGSSRRAEARADPGSTESRRPETAAGTDGGLLRTNGWMLAGLVVLTDIQWNILLTDRLMFVCFTCSISNLFHFLKHPVKLKKCTVTAAYTVIGQLIHLLILY